MYLYVLRCNTCKLDKPYTDFSKKSEAKRGYAYRCKSCHNTYLRDVWYKNNSESQKRATRLYKVMNRHRILAARYGCSETDILELFSQACDACEVCGSTKRLCVDHCHSTGKIRGILCHACNTALGFLKEEEHRALSMAGYIQKNVQLNKI